MRDKIQYIKEKKWIHYLFITIVGLLVSIPLLWMQIRETHDGSIHLIRIMGLSESISQGDFPFLVLPYICRDFGYSMTSFYPPIVTYIPYIFGIISASFINGLKIFAMITTILSGIFVYNFINEITDKKGISLIGAIIYIILPYRFENIYTRFAIGEFASFIFIPIVFQGLYNLLHKDKKKHYYIAIGALGLLLSHTISTLYTAIFCIIYILFNIKKFLNKEVTKKCVINIVFICLISVFFIIPLLEFKTSADYCIFEPRIMNTNEQYTQKKTIEPWQFIKDKGEENGVSFVVGVPAIFMLAITILVYSQIKEKHKDIYIICWIFGAISVFMCLKYFPWLYMPKILSLIQYPWRMLGFATFFFSVVFAINMYYLINMLKKEHMRNIIYIVFFIILAIFTFTKLNAYKVEDKEVDKRYEQWLSSDLRISHFGVAREYLPIKAFIEQNGYLNERENRIYILQGNATIEEENKEELTLEAKLKSVEKDTVIELPYIYYPGYTVILQKGEEKIKLDTFESEFGFVSIKILEEIGECTIYVDYTGTTLDKVSYAISAISLIGFVIYIIYFKKKSKIGESNEGKN